MKTGLHFRIYLLQRSEKYKPHENLTRYEKDLTLFVNESLLHIINYNINNNEKNDSSFSKVTKRRNVVLLKEGFKRQKLLKQKLRERRMIFMKS